MEILFEVWTCELMKLDWSVLHDKQIA